ncbi:arylsulfatase [Leifsonia kafniensis]|uniref:Arylsulfatase n=1 Tax=Leifsonia kafniensis TaxID=475957 RepID=A0ABP7KQI9_9MICO
MSAEHRRPDILVVVFDDMGYADLGCYGSSIRTPNVDALAARGTRFTSFDVTPLCSPTRAALLTGRNPHAVGMGTIVQFASGDPGYSGVIPPSAAMLPKLLKKSGYASGLFGKWHLSPSAESGPGGPYRQWPLAQGFDRFFGFLAGRVHQFRPELVQDNTFVETAAYGGRHVSELIIDEAAKWIGDHAYARPDDPYFAMISFGAVHSPHHAPDEYLEAYRDAFAHGWDEDRIRRHARQGQLGVIDSGAPLPESDPRIPAWESLSTEDRTIAERLMEAYAAHLEHADAELGRLLDTIRQLGREENTVVFVMSDNGATNAGGPMGTLNEEAVLNDSPHGTPNIDVDKIGGPEYYNQYPAGWGQASNTPFRRYKHTVHNGGTRSPLIVAGPAGDPGTVSTAPSYVTDVAPTILELAGVEFSAEIEGVAQLPFNGRSMVPSLGDGVEMAPRGAQYFEVAGHRAILHDGWKAVTFHGPGTDFDDDRWELYNVRIDPAEVIDRAADFPERLESLVKLWWDEARSNQVLPLANRGKNQLFRPHPDRQSWRFIPEMTPVPQASAPEISGHDFTISVALDAIESGDHGVLMAMGDVFGGVSLYILNDRVRFALNALGEVTTVELERDAHVGATSVVAGFRSDATGGGTISLSVNLGDSAQSTRVPWVPRLRFFMGTAQCARDQEASVVQDYVGPFAYSGRISQATVEIHPGDRPAVSAESLFEALMDE